MISDREFQVLTTAGMVGMLLFIHAALWPVPPVVAGIAIGWIWYLGGETDRINRGDS